jgi:hypothetical protein
MEKVTVIWNWLLVNGPTALMAFGALVLVATLVAKLTPTPKDDEVVGKVKGVFLSILDFLKVGRPKFLE